MAKNKQLTKLTAASNSLGIGLRANSTQLFPGLVKNVTELNISKCNLGVDFSSVLPSHLAEAKLKVLHVGHNKLAESSGTLRKEWNTMMTHPNTLRVLDFTCIGLNYRGIMSIFVSLAGSLTLEQLILDGNYMHDADGAQQHSHTFNEMKLFCKRNRHCQHLGVAGVGLNDHGIKRIADCIADSAFHSVSLASNRLSLKGVEILASALQERGDIALKELDIQRNIDSPDGGMKAYNLLSNTNLEIVHM
eukprot:TRINITY_DN113744_c0_g1_i1.p1 TRINITY_DN113744_c0_g1~~TRINITY_DN113744_c0_g1_i1.p1  ORF type:complete len:248 (-),score=24.55 TRINITY_DN113744_c0_g1_i1:111-854(-)